MSDNFNRGDGRRGVNRRGFVKAAVAGAALAGAPAWAQTLAPASASASGLAQTSASTQAPAHALASAPARAKAQVFAHRGASALRPEHTIASYAKAIADGADYIEPDLVCTRDGVLVARHEANLTETTDVARHPEFATRRARKTVDGEAHEGWFVEDFTLAELKTLRAVERLPKVRVANTAYDGQFQIPTWEEIIELVAAEAGVTGRVIGLVPELKSSTYFASIGLPLEDRFLATLAAHEYTRRAPLEIQSFEVANLKLMRERLGQRANLRLMQLVGAGPVRPSDVVAAGSTLTFEQMMAPAGLRDIARYADVVAPNTRSVIPLGADGRLLAPTALVDDAHRAGLLVHTWTFRPENRFLAADFRSAEGENARHPAGSVAEIRRYLAAGIDGFFSDDTALGRLAVDG